MDDDTLLGILLRGRPATVDDAARTTHLDPEQISAAIDRLREQGRIGGTGQTLAYPPPAQWMTEAVSAHTRRARAASEDAMSGIERILENLPTVLSAWVAGEISTDLVPTILRHGPYAVDNMMWELRGGPSSEFVAVLGSVERLMTPTSERAERFGGELKEDHNLRVIVPTAVTSDARVLERMSQYGPRGLEYRTLDKVPGWFWVDGDHIGLPYVWGEAAPTSVLGLRHEGLANFARAYFEEFWQRAEPLEAEQHTWSSLLHLMLQGYTLESASNNLGINPRTGRRRIAAAMRHYQAPTLFALGAAWTAARSAGAGGSKPFAAPTHQGEAEQSSGSRASAT